MSRKSLVRRWAAWLAVWAVVLHALAPGMAQAVVGWAEPDLAHEVCSSTGIVRLAEPVAEDSRDGGTGFGIHCEWCLFDVAADLPAANLLRFDPPPTADAPVALPPAPVLAFPWRPAQPRAPPSFA